jgi:hypothetical protein
MRTDVAYSRRADLFAEAIAVAAARAGEGIFNSRKTPPGVCAPLTSHIVCCHAGV